MQVDAKPNSITLVAALSACSAIGALVCGKEIHVQALPMLCLTFMLSVEGWNMLGNNFMCMMTRKWYLGTSCSLAMLEGGKETLPLGCLIGPDEVTFVILLHACRRSGMVSQGWKYLNSMDQDYAITPNLRHYAFMVDLLSHAGCLEEAHQYLKDMPIKPDVAIWGALLNGCRIHHQVELGEVAAKSIIELNSESVRYYVLLCNLNADGGRWDQVDGIRKVMSERGLMADPGCSWVEVKGLVHAFLSGDGSHPQTKDIHAQF